MKLWSLWQQAAKRLKREVMTLLLAGRHPATPWYAKVAAAAVAAYALSPIDLIPDFIPVLGYLDDLILVPLGLYLVIRLIPDEVMAECREEAVWVQAPGSRLTLAVTAIIILTWAATAFLLFLLIRRLGGGK